MGHPKARWRDDLDTFSKQHLGGENLDWFLLAPDRDAWDELEAEYARGLQRGNKSDD